MPIPVRRFDKRYSDARRHAARTALAVADRTSQHGIRRHCGSTAIISRRRTVSAPPTAGHPYPHRATRCRICGGARDVSIEGLEPGLRRRRNLCVSPDGGLFKRWPRYGAWRDSVVGLFSRQLLRRFSCRILSFRRRKSCRCFLCHGCVRLGRKT